MGNPKAKRSITIQIEGENAEQLTGQLSRIFEDPDIDAKLDAFYNASVPMPPRKWDAKRIVWWAVAALGGAGLSWLLHKKAPMINHAACAIVGKGVAESMGMKDRKSAILGATFALGSHWSADNMPLLHVAVAALGHGECIAVTGEFVADRFVEWKEEREAVKEAAAERTQEESLQEEASHEQ